MFADWISWCACCNSHLTEVGFFLFHQRIGEGITWCTCAHLIEFRWGGGGGGSSEGGGRESVGVHVLTSLNVSFSSEARGRGSCFSFTSTFQCWCHFHTFGCCMREKSSLFDYSWISLILKCFMFLCSDKNNYTHWGVYHIHIYICCFPVYVLFGILLTV